MGDRPGIEAAPNELARRQQAIDIGELRTDRLTAGRGVDVRAREVDAADQRIVAPFSRTSLTVTACGDARRSSPARICAIRSSSEALDAEKTA